MAVKTVFFHIGFAKTGTTSIQRFLTANRASLAGMGILYPRAGTCGMDPHHQLACSLPIADAGRDVGLTGPEAGFLDELIKEMEAFPGHACVISSEVLSAYSPYGGPDVLRRILCAYDCKVIAYLRRQDLWLNSWAVEISKNGHTLDIGPDSTHPACCLADYYESLQCWVTAFGRDAVLVRPFEKIQFRNGDLIGDFMHLLGVELPDDRLPVPSSLNESVHPWMTGIMMRFYHVLRDRWIETGYSQYAIQDYHWMTNLPLTAPDSEKTHFFGDKDAQVILARYAESNARVAKEFLGRTDGRLFYEPTEEVFANVPALQTGMEKFLVEFFMEALAHERFLHSQTACRAAEASAQAAVAETSTQAAVASINVTDQGKIRLKIAQKLQKQWLICSQTMEKLRSSIPWKLLRIKNSGREADRALGKQTKEINKLLQQITQHDCSIDAQTDTEQKSP